VGVCIVRGGGARCNTFFRGRKGRDFWEILGEWVGVPIFWPGREKKRCKMKIA
jgi:hypothetical protein